MKTAKMIRTMLALACATVVAACASGGTTLAGVKPYASDTCVMTDNKLGSMGPVVTKVYEGKEVKFCCKPCVAKFEKNPQKYLANL